MRKNNRRCIVCGKEYNYCPSCSEANTPSWKSIYHDENCKKVFAVASWYLSGSITKEQAKSKFEKCDLSKKYLFNAEIQRAINETMVKKEQIQNKADSNESANKINTKELLQDKKSK